MHLGIAEMAKANPAMSDEELAAKSGCDLTIVRQAKARYLDWKKESEVMAANPLSLDGIRSDGFPVYSLTLEEKWNEMRLLLNYDRTRLIYNGVIGQTMHGLALAWHYFPHAWSVQCGEKRSPSETFADDERLENALSRRRKYGTLKSESDLRKALRTVSGTQAVSNFRPSAAAALYDRYMPEGDGVTWDMSAGYGGRMLGAIASGRVKTYIGTDPASLTYDGLTEMEAELPLMAEQLGSERTTVELHKIGSENFVPDRGSIQLAFTSPPYFDAEHYSEEPTQSYIKFRTPEEWLNGFLGATLSNCHAGITASGILVVNIANVKTYPNLTEDFLWLARRCGFRHIETLRLALAAMPGTRTGSAYKHEPVYVFRKS